MQVLVLHQDFEHIPGSVYAQKVVVKPYNWDSNGFIFDLSRFLHKILSIYREALQMHEIRRSLLFYIL